MAGNLRGAFLMMKPVVPHMIAQGYGKIINIGSGTAFRGIPWMLHYVPRKGGIMAFTRPPARDLVAQHVPDNTRPPAFALTRRRLLDTPVPAPPTLDPAC